MGQKMCFGIQKHIFWPIIDYFIYLIYRNQFGGTNKKFNIWAINYEGRPINKWQNGIILLIFKI